MVSGGSTGRVVSAAAYASRATAMGMLSSAKTRRRVVVLVAGAGAGAGAGGWTGLGAARLRRPAAEEDEDMETSKWLSVVGAGPAPVRLRPCRSAQPGRAVCPLSCDSG